MLTKNTVRSKPMPTECACGARTVPGCDKCRVCLEKEARKWMPWFEGIVYRDSKEPLMPLLRRQ
jgi:hypothetical protein